MAKITIIGWYGTETMGDRAILAGLFDVFGRVWGSCEIFLGSLFPFFSQRTVADDRKFHEHCFDGKPFSLSIFNSRNIHELKTAIEHSDYVVLGGGPLMDLDELLMIEYALYLARNRHKRIFALGVGWGPLRRPEYIKSALKIVALADVCVVRDRISRERIRELAPDIAEKVVCSGDPSILAAELFRQKLSSSAPGSGDAIVVNFRDCTGDYPQFDPISEFCAIIRKLLEHQAPILLVPMHTFAIGYDDRLILNEVAKRIDSDLVTVQNRVVDLSSVMETFRRAKFCVGTRFHSVVLQTILNGKNFVVDYTDPQFGKISGFFDLFGLAPAMSGRYISLADPQHGDLDFSDAVPRIEFSADQIADVRNTYCQAVGSGSGGKNL